MPKIKIKRQQESKTEKTLRSAEFIGRNSYGQHSSLRSGEFRDIVDYEVFPTYLKSRRGSQFLKDTSKTANAAVLNAISWDTGTLTYLLYQQGNTIFYQRIDPTISNPSQVTDLDGVSTTIDGTARADFFLDGDKLFVIHEDGNKIIHYNSGSARFEMRDLGIDYPFISAISAGVGGNLEGDYTWGVELIYFPSSLSDVSYSSPNRFMTTRNLAELDGLSSNNALMVIQADELDGNDWWTHLRLWRSLRKNLDASDPTNPIDHFGVEDQLFLVAQITRAEMERGSLTAIAYGDDYPAGNEFVQSGKPGGNYAIVDNCGDEYLNFSIGIDRIELVPMPAAKIGVSHANRIFVSSVQQATLNNGDPIDDDSKNDIFYSNFAGSPYSELTKTIQFIPTTRDGQEMKKMISFEKDLIAIKESKTLRLPDGNVDFTIETIDSRIGIQDTQSAQYIPGLGVCAITNDYDDFAIFGFDNIWRKDFYGIPIARHIREDLADITQSNVSFIYINGKIMLSDGTGNVFILNVEAKRGWGRFTYATSDIDALVVFKGGRRALAIGADRYLLEIEDSSVDTDDNADTDETGTVIEPFYTGHMWQSGDGSDVLEFQWMGVMAYLSGTMTGIPYVNGLPWPDMVNAVEWAYVGQDGGRDALADREYRLYIEPQAMGSFDWMPPIGNYLHFKMITTAPAIIKVNKLKCIVDTDGLSYGDFDPFQTNYGPSAPPWATDYILYLKFDKDLNKEEDFSKNQADFLWSDGSGGSRTFDENLVPDGGQNLAKGAGSGYSIVDSSNLTVADKGIGEEDGGLCSKNLTFLIADTFPDVSVAEMVIDEDGDGTKYYRFKVLADGSIEFRWASASYDYSFTTAAGVVTQGSAAQYATLSQMIIFVLSNNGLNGQFYHGLVTDSNISTITTTRTAN